jgi:hypothetical protein
MAYFFNGPDFYNMQQASNNRFDRQIDDFVQSGPFAAYARYKQSRAAIDKEKAREAEEQRRYEAEQAMRQQYMQLLSGNRSAAQQTPPTQGQAAQEQQAPPQVQQPSPWDALVMGINPTIWQNRGVSNAGD